MDPIVLFLGCLAGLAAGYAPGINGRVGLVMALPFALALGPERAITFLVAMHSVVHTTSAIPAVLFGTPTSASEAATAMDGVPLARHNPARAAGLVINASFIGGAIGALGLWLLIPVFTFVLGSIGSPEFLALAILGMLSIAGLSGSSLLAGLSLGALGWVLSTVGLDGLTGAERLTFGRLELFDGLSSVALVTGLFSIPELLAPSKPGTAASDGLGWGAVRKMAVTLFEVARYWRVTAIASAIGFWVGFIPGIGASAAVWLAYAQARTQSPNGANFGHGEPEGVIAPEAANNAKEGGAFAPLLFLGIPGTTSLAIMVNVFERAGIDIGPDLLRHHSSMAFSVAMTILLANAIAVPMSWLSVPLITRYTLGHQEKIRIFALIFSVIVVILQAGTGAGLIQLAVFSLIGMATSQARLAKAPLLLGFIMGPLVEKMLIRTVNLYGSEALLRPGVLTIGAIGLLCLYYFHRLRDASGKPEVPRSQAFVVLAALAVFLAACIWPILSLQSQSRWLPLLAAAIGLMTSLAGMARLPWPRRRDLAEWAGMRAWLVFVVMLLGSTVFPFYLLGGLYTAYLVRRRCNADLGYAALSALAVGGGIYWIVT